MKLSNSRPFVYSNKFELRMFELRTEFELLFLRQQEQALVKRTAQQYITKHKHQ